MARACVVMRGRRWRQFGFGTPVAPPLSRPTPCGCERCGAAYGRGALGHSDGVAGAAALSAATTAEPGRRICAVDQSFLCASGAGHGLVVGVDWRVLGDRKSTRLNSSHVASSYAVFCL